MHKLIYLLWAQKLSRKRLNFPKNQKPWDDLEHMEKAVFDLYPDKRPIYKEFKEKESRRWGKNFGDAFKKDSFSLFLSENFGKPSPDKL